MANRWENNGNSDRLYFLELKKITAEVTAAMILKDTCSLKEKLTNLDSILKRRYITLPTKVLIVKVMVLPVVM